MSREESHVVTALAALCKLLNIKCAVQIGAWDGYEVEVVRSTVPCRGVAIEGDTRSVPCSPGLEYHYALIGATNCVMDFYLHPNAELSGQFPRGENSEEKVRLQQHRLDTFCEALGIKPDALIIDTEGSTLDVLEGCGAMLDSVNLVYAECQTYVMRPGIRPLADVDAFLAVRGLTRHHGLPSYSAGSQGNYTWARQ